jgi:hypothetical protein
MYAKTSILNQPEADYALLRTLIKAGAEIGWRDRLGRSVVEYVHDAGDARLENWLSSGEHS